MESLWRTEAADTALFEPFIDWAARTRQTLRALGAHNGTMPSTPIICVALSNEYAHLFAARRRSPRNLRIIFEPLDGNGQRDQAATLASASALSSPWSCSRLARDGSTDLAETLTRWTANIESARRKWTKWRAAAADAAAADSNRSSPRSKPAKSRRTEIAAAFEYAYAKWCADEIVNADPIFQPFLAEQHEALIEAFTAADDRSPNSPSRSCVPESDGGSCPSHDELRRRPRMGRPRPRGRQEDAPHAPAPAVRQNPERADAARALRDDEPAIDRPVPAARTPSPSTS